MKYFGLLLVCLGLSLLIEAQAGELNVMGGGLTYHWSSYGADQFSNKVSEDGRLISNKNLGVEYLKRSTGKYEAYKAFIGEDSVGSSIFGGAYSYGITEFNGLVDLGFIFGGYFDRPLGWDHTSVRPPRLFHSRENNIGFVPVVGAEINFKIPIYKNLHIKQNNVISPAITNHTIGFGWDF